MGPNNNLANPNYGKSGVGTAQTNVSQTFVLSSLKSPQTASITSLVGLVHIVWRKKVPGSGPPSPLTVASMGSTFWPEARPPAAVSAGKTNRERFQEVKAGLRTQHKWLPSKTSLSLKLSYMPTLLIAHPLPPTCAYPQDCTKHAPGT